MQLKAKEILNWHPIEGFSYITRGTIYPVIEAVSRGVFIINDDTQQRRVVALDNCAHGVVWEVVDQVNAETLREERTCEHTWVYIPGFWGGDNNPLNQAGYSGCRKCGAKHGAD